MVFVGILLGISIGAFWGSIINRLAPDAIHTAHFWFTTLGIVAMFTIAYFIPNGRIEVIVFSVTLLLSATAGYARATRPIEERDRRPWTHEPWAETEPKF